MSEPIEFLQSAQHVPELTSTSSQRPWKQRLILMGIVAAVVFCLSLTLPTHYHVEAQGIVLPARSAWVGSPTGGIVAELFAQSGQWVHKGEPLLRLQNTQVMADLHAAQSEAFLSELLMHTSSESATASNQEYVGTAAQRMEGALINYENMVYRADELVLRSPIEGQVVSPYLSRLIGAYVPPQTELLQIADTRDLIILIPIAEDNVDKIEIGSPIKARWVSTGTVFHTQINGMPTRKAKLDDYSQAMYATFGGPAPQQMLQPILQPEKNLQEDPNATLYPIFIAEAPVPENAWVRCQPQMRLRVTIQGKPTTIGAQLKGWWQNLRRKR